MKIELRQLQKTEIPEFKREMQKAFQIGSEAVYGKTETQILPESDIDRSLAAKGSAAFAAFAGGEMIGGAIVVLNKRSRHGHLDFLFVKVGVQGKGVGKVIWSKIERLYPDVKIWETCTPYFEKKNIHFYINRCGFHAVEFFNSKHPDPNDKKLPDAEKPDDDGMFRFEKVVKQ